MALKAWTLGICTATNVYLLGAMLVFALVSYPSLASAEQALFPSLYAEFTGRLVPLVVPAEFLAAGLTFPLYGWRPAAVPLWSVHLLVALAVGYFVITFAWHLPAHRALAAGDSSGSAFAPLMSSQWARTWLQVGRTLVLLGLGVKAISS
jgi:hypothetical protein